MILVAILATKPPPPQPTTIADAADQIAAKLDAADRKLVRETKRDDLIWFHHGWGTQIRNNLGLWQDVSALREDCARREGRVDTHPDNCSMMIIEAVWDRLQ